MERPAPLDRLLTPIFLSLSLSLSFCSLVCKPALPRGENKTTRERKRGGDEREVRATRKQSFSPLPSFRSSSPLSSVSSSSSSSSSLVPTLLLLYATSTTPCNIYEIGVSSSRARSIRLFLGEQGTKSFHGFLRKHGRDTPLRASITTVSPANSRGEIELALILIRL